MPITQFTNTEHIRQLEDWMRSYAPQELFDATGRFRKEFAELAPMGNRRMGANPHANGGALLAPLAMPNFRDFAVPVSAPGSTMG